MSAIENVKEVADLIKKFNDIDLNRRILNLENEVLDLSRDKRRAEEKVEELEGLLKFSEKLTFGEPFYWLEKDSTPYCPQCWEAARTPIHLLYKGHMTGGHRYDCPKCTNVFCSAVTPAPTASLIPSPFRTAR
jgi:hypothetical protein